MLFVDIFFAVIRDVNERRFEIHDRIQYLINALDAFPLQWRQYLHGKEGFPVGVFEVFGDFHTFALKVVKIHRNNRLSGLIV